MMFNTYFKVPCSNIIKIRKIIFLMYLEILTQIQKNSCDFVTIFFFILLTTLLVLVIIIDLCLVYLYNYFRRCTCGISWFVFINFIYRVEYFKIILLQIYSKIKAKYYIKPKSKFLPNRLQVLFKNKSML